MRKNKKRRNGFIEKNQYVFVLHTSIYTVLNKKVFNIQELYYPYINMSKGGEVSGTFKFE